MSITKGAEHIYNYFLQDSFPIRSKIAKQKCLVPWIKQLCIILCSNLWIFQLLLLLQYFLKGLMFSRLLCGMVNIIHTIMYAPI